MSLDAEKATNLAGHETGQISISHDLVRPELTDYSDHPTKWPRLYRNFILAQVAFSAFICSFTTAIMVPAIGTIAKELHIPTQRVIDAFAVHILFLGLGPFFWMPLAKICGSRPVMIISTLVVCLASVGGGYVQDQGQLIAVRLFQGIGNSAGLVIPGAVVVDLFSPEERGVKNGLWTCQIVTGGAVASVVAGPLVQYCGWRWAFWLPAIITGVQTLVFLFSYFETSHVLRQHMSRGQRTARELWSLPSPIKDLTIWRVVCEPLLFLQAPHIVLITLAYSVAFAFCLPGIASALALTFGAKYGFGALDQGLVVLSNLVGAVIGEVVGGPGGDWIMRRERRLAREQRREEVLERRLLLTLPGYILAVVGVVMYGVTIQAHAHWIVPCIAWTLASLGLQIITTPMNTYCVDCYPGFAGSVLQLVNAGRQVVAFTVPYFGPKLNQRVGYGVGMGLEATIMGVFFLISLIVLWKGPALRETTKVRRM